MADGGRQLSKNEQGVMVAAAAALILSLLPWYITVTFDGKGFDTSSNAWSGYSTIGMVLLLGGAALIAIEAFSDGTLPDVVPWRLIAVVATVFGTFLIILRAITAGSSAPGANVGPGWSGFLLFLAAIAVAAYAVLTFRGSEETIDLSDANPDE
jgi:hypothetical protein